MLTTPFGYAGLGEQLGQQVAVERRLRRRLDHDRAAGQQRRDQLGHDRELRDVPRRDRGDHADRLAAYDDRRAHHAGALLLPRELAGDAEERLDLHPRRRRLRQVGERRRRAHLEGDQVGHLGQLPGVQPGEGLDDVDPLLRRHPRPRALVEGAAGGRDRGVDVGRSTPRGRGRRPARSAGETTSSTSVRGRGGPAAVDEEGVAVVGSHRVLLRRCSGQGAWVNQSVKPVGSWRPRTPCS